jgi:hypothetical protein
VHQGEALADMIERLYQSSKIESDVKGDGNHEVLDQ